MARAEGVDDEEACVRTHPFLPSSHPIPILPPLPPSFPSLDLLLIRFHMQDHPNAMHEKSTSQQVEIRDASSACMRIRSRKPTRYHSGYILNAWVGMSAYLPSSPFTSLSGLVSLPFLTYCLPPFSRRITPMHEKPTTQQMGRRDAPSACMCIRRRRQARYRLGYNFHC